MPGMLLDLGWDGWKLAHWLASLFGPDALVGVCQTVAEFFAAPVDFDAAGHTEGDQIGVEFTVEPIVASVVDMETGLLLHSADVATLARQRVQVILASLLPPV